MSRIHPECPDSDPSDWLVVPADVLLRQEPDEEDEEEEDDRRRLLGVSVPIFVSVGEGLLQIPPAGGVTRRHGRGCSMPLVRIDQTCA